MYHDGIQALCNARVAQHSSTGRNELMAFSDATPSGACRILQKL